MCYRELWVQHHGPIPKDDRGRSYEIHHINGIHTDDRIENLTCLSIEDHFQIHWDQGDMRAAAAIARRMFVEPDKQTELNRLSGLEAYRLKKGIHGWSTEEKSMYASKGGKACKGLLWWNNGSDQTKAKESPGVGWVRGKLPCNGMPKGTVLGVFWNNGSQNQRSVECPGEGWVRGRLLSEQQRQRRSEISRKMAVDRWRRHRERL